MQRAVGVIMVTTSRITICHRSHRDCQHCIIRIIMIVIRGAALDSAMGALSSLTWFMFTHASCGDLPSPLSTTFEQDACRSPAVARAVIHRASRDARLTRIDIIDPQSSRKSFLLRVSPSTGISSAKQDVLGQYSLCKKTAGILPNGVSDLSPQSALI